MRDHDSERDGIIVLFGLFVVIAAWVWLRRKRTNPKAAEDEWMDDFDNPAYKLNIIGETDTDIYGPTLRSTDESTPRNKAEMHTA